MTHVTPHAAKSIDLPVRWPAGIRAAATRVGIRSLPGDDLILLVADPGATVAAVFTRSRFAAAPIELSRRHLADGGGAFRGLLVNAGCANAATGDRGRADAERCVATVAEAIGAEPTSVLVNSTGVIGVHLPVDAMVAAIPSLAAAASDDTAAIVARAIMTTDTAPKGVERTVAAADGGTIRIVGVAKGSGMIHPNMATMIGIVTTDAAIEPAAFDRLLRTAVDASFNRVSVDGDTSTNDSVFAIAGGTAGPPADADAFAAAFTEVCVELALMIVADGEGATRTLVVEAVGAATAEDAREVAWIVGSSLLVRTAVAGGDPNWGRIIAALGRTTATFDPDAVTVSAGDVVLFEQGGPTGLDATAAFAAEEVVIRVDLAAGPHADRHLTCDLTAEYVRINADYTT